MRSGSGAGVIVSNRPCGNSRPRAPRACRPPAVDGELAAFQDGGRGDLEFGHAQHLVLGAALLKADALPMVCLRHALEVDAVQGDT